MQINAVQSHIQTLPAKIWLFWDKGIEKAPYVVRQCFNSWQRHNPDWDIVLLDERNVNDYAHIDLCPDKLRQLPIQKRSNLLRLKLLSEHGGVWVDATAYCMQPLSSWLNDCMNSGFFCFHQPGRDRIMSNWFMAAHKKHPIITKLYDAQIDYWSSNSFKVSSPFKQKLIRFLERRLGKNSQSTRIWFSWPIVKLLQIYPYFVFHYMFNDLATKDNEFRNLWHLTTKYSANGPHRLQKVGLFEPIDNCLKGEIDNYTEVLYKLTWKYPPDQYAPGTIMHYLLESK